MWLKPSSPALRLDRTNIEKDPTEAPATLRAALEASGAAVQTLLGKSLEMRRITGVKPHPAAFLGYLIAHESHRRGEIELTLTQAGHKLDQKTSYGLWEWGVR